MLVLCAIVDIEIIKQMTSQDTLGKHTLYCMADDALRTKRLLAKLLRGVETLTTGITSITSVNLIGLLLTCEDYLLGIDNNYIVTTIYMRGE